MILAVIITFGTSGRVAANAILPSPCSARADVPPLLSDASSPTPSLLRSSESYADAKDGMAGGALLSSEPKEGSRHALNAQKGPAPRLTGVGLHDAADGLLSASAPMAANAAPAKPARIAADKKRGADVAQHNSRGDGDGGPDRVGFGEGSFRRAHVAASSLLAA